MAHLELWLKHSKSITYTDDTGTSVSGKIQKEIMAKMEEDANNVLKYMSSMTLLF